MKHHKYDVSDYVILRPDRKSLRIAVLERENKLLLQALWYCGKSRKLDSIEAGVKSMLPKELVEQIDFQRVFDTINCETLEVKNDKF